MSPTLFASRILFHLAASRKGYKGGEGGHQICIYTMGYGQIHRVVTQKKESGEFALHCFCFRQMPSTKLGGTKMPCYSIAIRADYTDYTLTLPENRHKFKKSVYSIQE